ncbi:MAG: biopolymer transporter ExbD [Anderseniella sp.]
MKPFRISTPTPRRRSPDLTPVMDVVFILVVFFMIVSTFSQTLVKPLKVSVPGTAAPALSPVESRVLELTATGAVLDGEAVTDLAASLAGDTSETLSIVAGEGASYQALVDALDAAQIVGIVDVRVRTAGDGS